ncbi:hypothetical protein D9758_013934 [Tetrapyrgos nigripes]|uniref:Uncharacterized protein n=1 Tax=Tetrapyrgos nigripes TaxID=182062 RepID=A0A8H5FLT2_9AGAR|nr:hypothetical protein D9758_013934 [Tetrapyrgos nigripes]
METETNPATGVVGERSRSKSLKEASIVESAEMKDPALKPSIGYLRSLNDRDTSPPPPPSQPNTTIVPTTTMEHPPHHHPSPTNATAAAAASSAPNIHLFPPPTPTSTTSVPVFPHK